MTPLRAALTFSTATRFHDFHFSINTSITQRKLASEIEQNMNEKQMQDKIKSATEEYLKFKDDK